MGLFSFLLGGKTKEAAKTVEAIAPVMVSPVVMSSMVISPMVISQGVVQAKLRLKLAASLRSGQRMAAYDAARALADIQMRAGRKTVARVWLQEADRIKATLGA